MKIRIELQEEEEEIIIRCKKIDDRILKIQQYLATMTTSEKTLTYYKGQEEYYFPVQEVLFFETADEGVYAHTINEAFRIKSRLYELESELPNFFVRVSKSTILNVCHVFSIERNLSSSSRVKFRNSYKEVFVSRMYFKSLKYRLQERNVYNG